MEKYEEKFNGLLLSSELCSFKKKNIHTIANMKMRHFTLSLNQDQMDCERKRLINNSPIIQFK